VFQPAEEGEAGARRMLEDGFLDLFPCEAMFGMHNAPGKPAGKFMVVPGFAMASGDTCLIKVRGVGGHGAMPQAAVDPVVAASSIVMALQTIVSRNVAPLQMSVITVGSLQAGDAHNVIPQSATLKLSVRSLDREVHKLLNQRIRELVEAQAQSYGCKASIEFRGGYPVLVNTQVETDFARQVALELVGADHVELQTAPLTGSEDFAFMLEQVPGSYLLIGNGDEASGGHGACMVHNPNYDFDDRNIAIGAAYWTRLAERFLTA
jgi:hippurate hydrolase